MNYRSLPTDLDSLLALGPILDTRPASLRGRTIAMALAAHLLRVRTRTGATAPLRANPVQRLFERRRGQHNIVLKARQLGLTTWAAARFFLKTITCPGTLTLQVAHTQESAEEIFRIVHRFLDSLPQELREGPLATSRDNVRQIVFPALDSQYRVISAGDRNAGRGLTVQNLHCSELARWPGNPAEILAGLRAALSPDAEVILESTPHGVGGCFYEEWQKAPETGLIRHFFPWWMEKSYRADAVDAATLSEEEQKLRTREGLSLEQIGYRRRLRSRFRSLARQEYAEDPESCFLASGDSVFELSAIDARLSTCPPPVETRRNGELEIWLPPVLARPRPQAPSRNRQGNSATEKTLGAPGLAFETWEADPLHRNNPGAPEPALSLSKALAFETRETDPPPARSPGAPGLAFETWDTDPLPARNPADLGDSAPIVSRILTPDDWTNNRLPPQKKYLVAVDPAGGGTDGDYSAAQVIELETALQCAEFAGHLGGLELARLITALAREYNTAWLVIERNNHGSGILALVETVCAYPRIYCQSGQPGWLTTSLSRPAMLGHLDAALIEHPECFMSRRLLAECRSFVRRPDGTTAARPGTHDDRVLAMAIALAARADLLKGQFTVRSS